MTSPLRALAAVLLLMFLVGCGQSGPLFVPGDPSVIEPQPQTDAAEEDEDEDDENAGRR